MLAKKHINNFLYFNDSLFKRSVCELTIPQQIKSIPETIQSKNSTPGQFFISGILRLSNLTIEDIAQMFGCHSITIARLYEGKTKKINHALFSEIMSLYFKLSYEANNKQLFTEAICE